MVQHLIQLVVSLALLLTVVSGQDFVDSDTQDFADQDYGRIMLEESDEPPPTYLNTKDDLSAGSDKPANEQQRFVVRSMEEEEKEGPAPKKFLDELKKIDGLQARAEAEAAAADDDDYEVETEGCKSNRVIHSGNRIALQIDNKRFYMGCWPNGHCVNAGCPNYKFEKIDRDRRCGGEINQIFRMRGAGPVRVGDLVGIHFPYQPGTWLGCANQQSCQRAGCPGRPNLHEGGFSHHYMWFRCWGEVFRIFSTDDNRQIGQPIRANDKIGLFFLRGHSWLSFPGARYHTSKCPGAAWNRPPPSAKYEGCWGETFTLIDLEAL